MGKPDNTELYRWLLAVLAENQRNITHTANEMHYSRQTIKYHIKRIWDLTGKNPQDADDLAQLLKMDIFKTEKNGGG